MAIVVEDGSIVTGANSYVSEAEVTAYATERGITLTATESVLIYKAMDYFESLDFIGEIYQEDQPLQWPRVQAVIDGYEVDYNEIPNEVKQAQLSIAIAIDEGYGPLQNVDRQVSREKVDVIEVSYAAGSTASTFSPTINAKVKKLLKAAGGTKVWRV